MGLDATVFFAEEHVPERLRSARYVVEPLTGEFETEEEFDHLRDEFQACTHRLGNIGGVGYLRELLTELGLPVESVLLRQVLYSGSHCGDYIPMADNERMEAELNSLSTCEDEAVRAFVQSMTELLEASRREQRPIVFT